jgi:hypothetical protein
MRVPPFRPAISIALLCALALLAAGGCGDGGGGEEATTAKEAATTAKAKATSTATPEPKPATPDSDAGPPPPSEKPTNSAPPASAFQPKPHHDSGGGAEQFIVKGADNSVQKFGAEAEPSELEAAATALHAFLDARAERNWTAACAYLSAETKHGFAQLAGGSHPTTCATSLATLSGKVPTATLREAAIADVGSLRREGARAFLIYRGAPQGTIYAIPVIDEHGAWKVASLAGTPLN